jgi:phospholipid/cholesterol/gamma-HCH transport system ATP-binding protein
MPLTCFHPNSAAACESALASRGHWLSIRILFFDEPSAGLDPITSSRLDDLIVNLRDGLGATIVMVSHELPSLFAIADDGVFLDAQTKTVIAHGSPSVLRETCIDPQVRAFMRRQQADSAVTNKG